MLLEWRNLAHLTAGTKVELLVLVMWRYLTYLHRTVTIFRRKSTNWASIAWSQVRANRYHFGSRIDPEQIVRQGRIRRPWGLTRFGVIRTWLERETVVIAKEMRDQANGISKGGSNNPCLCRTGHTLAAAHSWWNKPACQHFARATIHNFPANRDFIRLHWTLIFAESGTSHGY